MNSVVNYYLDRYTERERIPRILLGTTRIDPIVIVPATENMKKRIKGCFRSSSANGSVLRLRDRDLSVSLCPTGIGAPSAEIILNALIAAGARILLRFDVCGGLLPNQDIGHVFLARQALSCDGVSGHYQRDRLLPCSEPLFRLYHDRFCAEKAALPHCSVGTVATVDIFFAQTDELHREWSTQAGALDMETAALYAIAAANRVEALSILTISDIRLQKKDALLGKNFDYMAFRSGMKQMLETIVPFCQSIRESGLLREETVDERAAGPRETAADSTDRQERNRRADG